MLNLTDGASSSADGFPAGSLPLGVAVCLSEHGQLSSEMQQQIPSDPSLTFLYSRMNPAVMSQLEAWNTENTDFDQKMFVTAAGNGGCCVNF